MGTSERAEVIGWPVMKTDSRKLLSSPKSKVASVLPGWCGWQLCQQAGVGLTPGERLGARLAQRSGRWEEYRRVLGHF